MKVLHNGTGKVTAISVAMTAVALLPVFLLVIILLMAVMHERLIKKA